MKKEISERVNQLVVAEKSRYAFAKKIGIPLPNIYKNMKGGANVGSETLALIAVAYPNLNTRWLLTGEGKMWLDDTPEPEPSPPLPKGNAPWETA